MLFTTSSFACSATTTTIQSQIGGKGVSGCILFENYLVAAQQQLIRYSLRESRTSHFIAQLYRMTLSLILNTNMDIFYSTSKNCTHKHNYQYVANSRRLSAIMKFFIMQFLIIFFNLSSAISAISCYFQVNKTNEKTSK